MNPLITVITVVFNGEEFLEETILSIVNQTYENFEYIIIDGGSSDDSLSIIKKYEDVIDFWVSEKDKGIYDAMNKGVCFASGKFINFLNAGDLYTNSEILKSVAMTLEKENADISAFGFSIENTFYYSDLSFLGLLKGMPCHQAIFYKSSFLKNRPFDTYFKYSSDYHNLLNAIFTKTVLTFKNIVVIYDNNGVSSNVKVQRRIRFERFISVYKSNIPIYWKFPMMFYNLIRMIG